MADEFSFDVVSKVDLQVVEDCVHVSNKEITNRFDFKGSISKIELNAKELALTVTSDDEFKLKAVHDVLNTRLAKRGLPLKNFAPQKIETALGGAVRQLVKVQQGIPSDKAKEMAAAIKKSGIKAQAAIQGDQLRVSSKSKDALQEAIALLKGGSFGVDLQITNFR